MKVQIRLYRVAKVSVVALAAIAGIGEKEEATHEKIMAKIADTYGPLAMCLRIFWPPEDPMSTRFGTALAGMEVMGFDLRDVSVPQAGLVEHDPLIANEVHRLDGALRGELARLGIFTEIEEFSWRCAYEIRGN